MHKEYEDIGELLPTIQVSEVLFPLFGFRFCTIIKKERGRTFSYMGNATAIDKQVEFMQFF